MSLEKSFSFRYCHSPTATEEKEKYFLDEILKCKYIDNFLGIYGNFVERILVVIWHFGMHLIGALGVEDDHNDHNYTSSSPPLHLLTAYHPNINIEPNYKISTLL